MFQFLIGRLGTLLVLAQFLKLYKFQFLIGRLGTCIRSSRSDPYSRFQFLIGRLGTFKQVYHGAKYRCFNSS